MKITTILPLLSCLGQVIAVPTNRFYPPSLNSMNTTTFSPIPSMSDSSFNMTTSPCLTKLEGTLKDLTSSTLSILFGSSSTLLGYAVCGLTMPPEAWEKCTDFAVIGGSLVGLSHLAIWKLPEVLDHFDMYQSVVRPWEESPAAWGEDEGPDGKVEMKPRINDVRASLGAWP